MQRIFITGGTGFFGKSILDYRLRPTDFLADADLTILSRDPDAFVSANPKLAEQAGVHFVQGDVRTFSIGSPRFDSIIHAATAAVTTLSDDEMYSTIVDGTRHVLDFAKVYVPNVERALSELGLSVKVNLAEAIRLSAAPSP